LQFAPHQGHVTTSVWGVDEVSAPLLRTEIIQMKKKDVMIQTHVMKQVEKNNLR
jgi:ABC-type uncharacterized transport system ATPase subunit